MFNSQNFALFQAFIYGFITHIGSGTLTRLYQASASQTRYGSFPKFLSRGNWDADALAAHLIKYLQSNIRRLRYQTMSIANRDYQIASHLVRTKMCPVDVRLLVIRSRSKPSKPYRYFLVFTTDLTLEIPQIIEYSQQRWQIETAFRDLKQAFGFSGYRVKSRKSINRFVQLSFIAASLTKLIFSMPHPTEKPINVKTVCEHLGIHWYQPKKLTQGLRMAYLQSQIKEQQFSMSSPENTNSQNITPVFQQDTTLPLDKAA